MIGDFAFMALKVVRAVLCALQLWDI